MFIVFFYATTTHFGYRSQVPVFINLECTVDMLGMDNQKVGVYECRRAVARPVATDDKA
jgi:hypothetical protein